MRASKERPTLWVMLPHLLLAAVSVHADVPGVADLPITPPAAPLSTRDWLVEPPARGARITRSEDGAQLVLDNGLIRRTIRVAPDGATVGLDDLTTGASLLRAVRPEAVVVLDGERHEVGGLTGQPNHAFLLPGWVEQMQAQEGAFHLVSVETGQPTERLAWERVRHHAAELAWPPEGVALHMTYGRTASDSTNGVTVTVHYELYDGIPAMSKWITVENRGERPVELDSFKSEILAVVEDTSRVEDRGLPYPTPSALHVETDYAMSGMTAANANRHGVHWREDPRYGTQVNYLRNTPCLLEVGPELGPAQTLEPGASFESMRAFLLVQDSTERERRGLARRRLYRTVAPWVTENPLMMHVRFADDATVRRAIDQCAEVGFEMVILTFGSGFNIEDDRPEALARWKETADYAASKGIEIGGYSLLSSRRISPVEDNCINPETGQPGAAIHGNCPALASAWGQQYLAKLRHFFDETGFRLLEHDGSYPGTLDAAARPPLQKGVEDSRWVQWRLLTDFYARCRGAGVYLNVPDYYYLAGANKCGMGYREVNWSLPRAQQVLHTRQNIFDGTWEKTPSMGWMFVPLTEYHGGGPAATIEPLDEHLDHYERMLASNLGLGVQACYRGPRLYDTERTRDAVRAWVDWYKRHRALLESDLVHGRRADGRDLDWMLHVNPGGEDRGMLVVFNPLEEPRTRTLDLDLHYTGLRGSAGVRSTHPHTGEGVETTHPLDHGRLRMTVTVPPGGMGAWILR